MNGTARSLAFADGGRPLLSFGGDGHVYHWDLFSGGIFNVYNREEFLEGKKKPKKVIKNLTTEVDFLTFNHDAQILAISSSKKKNRLKLIYVPSFTVFSNWPYVNHFRYHHRCLDFSPGGGFMAMGNAEGKVLLYKLHHYQRA
ncbi:hypothetical protein GIB67_039887 [Kingdonia uniflora]|uniref:Uncharacterized protein n=1 Tax=Kingdonia uniflora TaxID=39325 RepID=A0A7J7P3A6_9MAGN|nr:hypothetical protein GIB67_039887 [Kingdonia uniflora]